MSTNDDLEYDPCGGCGADHPSQRCIGCFHPFGRGRKRKASETPPAEPAPRDICFDGKCPVKVTHYVGEAPGCQPPRQEGETPETKAWTNEHLLGYDEHGGVWITSEDPTELMQKLELSRNAAERRAADAEDALANASIDLDALKSFTDDGGCRNGIWNRAEDIQRNLRKALARESTSDPADTLPGTARFEEVEKPHPDSLRLQGVLRSIKEDAERIISTKWGYDGDCGATVRAQSIVDAVDAAMSAPSAKGATP